MRVPLIRPGAGQTGVHQLYQQHAEERRELEKMLNTALASETTQERRHRGLAGFRSAAGDEHRLRGIPIAMPGVPGAAPGTVPHHIR